MTEKELQAIKGQLANVPGGWTISEAARIIEGLKVRGNYLAAEVTVLHSLRDSQSEIIERLREEVSNSRKARERKRKEAKVLANACRKHKAENKRLNAALEKIAYTSSLKELYEAEAFADRVLRGEPND